MFEEKVFSSKNCSLPNPLFASRKYKNVKAMVSDSRRASIREMAAELDIFR